MSGRKYVHLFLRTDLVNNKIEHMQWCIWEMLLNTKCISTPRDFSSTTEDHPSNAKVRRDEKSDEQVNSYSYLPTTVTEIRPKIPRSLAF